MEAHEKAVMTGWWAACLRAYPPPSGVEEWVATHDGGDDPNAANLNGLANVPDAYRRAVHDLLIGLGVIDPRTDGFATPTAYYFAQSLAATLGEGALSPLAWGDDTPSAGARLLALFEANRLQATAHPAPMRVVRVVTGVFKARRRRDGADLYLMQFDHRAGRYQPIGGKCEAGDVSNEAALLREICEELVVADLRPGVDLVIEPLLEHVQTAEVSASLGVITQYDHNFFLVKTVRFPIRIDADTRWLSERELLAGRADDGRAVTPLLHSHMAALLPALPYSLADAVD